METTISQSEFHLRVPEYLKEIEQTGEALVITRRGKPILKIVPYEKKQSDILKSLRNSVIQYDHPTSPVGLEDWESLK